MKTGGCRTRAAAAVVFIPLSMPRSSSTTRTRFRLGKEDIRNLLLVLLVTVRSASSTPFADPPTLSLDYWRSSAAGQRAGRCRCSDQLHLKSVTGLSRTSTTLGMRQLVPPIVITRQRIVWARHRGRLIRTWNAPMSVVGHKRKYSHRADVVALPLKADIRSAHL